MKADAFLSYNKNALVRAATPAGAKVTRQSRIEGLQEVYHACCPLSKRGKETMRYPVAKEAFIIPEIRGNEPLIRVATYLACTLNTVYDLGKELRNPDLIITEEIIRNWQEALYKMKIEGPANELILQILVDRANEAYQQGVAEAEIMWKTIPIEEVKVYPCFAAHRPKRWKMKRAEQRYLQSGMRDLDIVVNADGYLIDGYCALITAKKMELTHVPVRTGRCLIIRAVHKAGGKRYMWKLPDYMTDQVQPGDEVIVRTARGVKRVYTVSVEEYAGDENDCMRKAIRKRVRGGKKND